MRCVAIESDYLTRLDKLHSRCVRKGRVEDYKITVWSGSCEDDFTCPRRKAESCVFVSIENVSDSLQKARIVVDDPDCRILVFDGPDCEADSGGDSADLTIYPPYFAPEATESSYVGVGVNVKPVNATDTLGRVRVTVRKISRRKSVALIGCDIKFDARRSRSATRGCPPSLCDLVDDDLRP